MGENPPAHQIEAENLQPITYLKLFELSSRYKSSVFPRQREISDFPCSFTTDTFAVGLNAKASADSVKKLRAECLGCPRREACLYDTIAIEYGNSKKFEVGAMLAGGVTPLQRTNAARWVIKSMQGLRNPGTPEWRETFLGTLYVQLMLIAESRRPILREEE